LNATQKKTKANINIKKVITKKISQKKLIEPSIKIEKKAYKTRLLKPNQ
jgi:hypothetical protein